MGTIVADTLTGRDLALSTLPNSRADTKPTLMASEIRPASPPATPSKPPVIQPEDMPLVGILELLRGGLWRVDGTQVIIDKNTVVSGVLPLGSQVTVEGRREGGSAVRAFTTFINSGLVPTVLAPGLGLG